MKKNNMQNVSSAGNIYKEIAEINKLQKGPDGLLTIWTNTCMDIRTVFCC